MSRLTQDRTAKSISRNQILTRERGQGNIISGVRLTLSRIGSLNPVDPYSVESADYTYIRIY